MFVCEWFVREDVHFIHTTEQLYTLHLLVCGWVSMTSHLFFTKRNVWPQINEVDLTDPTILSN